MASRLILFAILIAVFAQFSSALAIGYGLLVGIVVQCRLMIYAAQHRNQLEQHEFQQVNDGRKEPDPGFLYRIWTS